MMPHRLFAIGDIHGCFDQLRRLVENSINPTRNDRIILIGDYIDRGPYSKEVIDYIIDLQSDDYDIIPLMGNHEAMLLDALDIGDSSLWLWNGGVDTLKSFNINSLNELDKKYIHFFENLRWYYDLDNFLFVHAGFNDSMKNPFEDKQSMVWIRKENYYNPVLKDRIIVHGHTPVPAEVLKNDIICNSRVINIDTGCVYSGDGLGRLTAIEMYSGVIYFAEC